MQRPKPESVLNFWFHEIPSEKWWKKDKHFDEEIKNRFSALHVAANRCELYPWRSDAEGRLAEIIVLDQFSRNIHRDHAEAFASDSLALALAQEAVRLKLDSELPSNMRAFMYMPYMHSESLIIHREAMQLFDTGGIESNLEFERKHLAIIERFGRYPHRNQLLGRSSTQEEIDFLKQPGSSF